MKSASTCLLIPVAIATLALLLLAQPLVLHSSSALAAATLPHFNDTLHSQNGSTIHTLHADSTSSSTMEARLFQNLSTGLLINSSENVSDGQTLTHSHELISCDVGSHNTTKQTPPCLISTTNPEKEQLNQQEPTSLINQQELPTSHDHKNALQSAHVIEDNHLLWVKPQKTREQESLNPLIPSVSEQKSLNQQEPTSLQKDSLPSMDVITSTHALAADSEHMRSTTPPRGDTDPIHTVAQISSARDLLQVMVISGNEHVLLVDEEEQLRATTPPPGVSTPINTADPKSTARDQSTRVMVISGDNVILVDDEQFRGTTPPPGSTPIHTAAPRSVARDSLQVTVIDEHAVVIDNRRRLGTHSTPPPGMDTPIHTAAPSSLARERAQAIVINDEDEVVMFHTPSGTNAPQIDQMEAASSSVSTQSMQVMVISDDDSVIMINDEQLGRATPPPGDTPIHTADARSVARNSVQVMVLSGGDDDDDDDVVVVNEAGP